MYGKVKTYLRSLLGSATDPTYYLSVLTTKLSFSLKFFLVSLAIVAPLDVFIIRTRDVPKIATALKIETLAVLQALPDEFEVKYKDNRLELAGVNLPLQIPTQNKESVLGLKSNFVTLTQSEERDESSTLTFSPTKMYVNSLEVTPLSFEQIAYTDLLGKNSFSLGKKQITDIVKAFWRDAPQVISLFSVLAVPLWFVGLLVSSLLMLFLLTIIANSLTWMLALRLPLAKTAQLGLHALAVATYLDVIKFVLYPGTHFSLVVPAYCGIMAIVLLTLRFYVRKTVS